MRERGAGGGWVKCECGFGNDADQDTFPDRSCHCKTVKYTVQVSVAH